MGGTKEVCWTEVAEQTPEAFQVSEQDEETAKIDEHAQAQEAARETWYVTPVRWNFNFGNRGELETFSKKSAENEKSFAGLGHAAADQGDARGRIGREPAWEREVL